MKKIRAQLQKLTFRKTVLILTVAVIVLVVVDQILFPSTVSTTHISRDSAGNTYVDFDYKEALGFTNEADGTNTGVSDTTAKAGVLAAMPFHNDKFTITYVDGSQEFDVVLNPASDATQQDVYKWFGQFSDVPDPTKLNIKFIDNAATGAPASPP